MTLNALAVKFTEDVSGTVVKTVELSTTTDVISLARGKLFNLGTGANQADQFFHDERTLADAANETLDFTDSSLTDKLGEAIDLSKLKALFIHNGSADASLIIGGAAANQLPIFGAGTHTLILPPGGDFMFTCPDVNGVDVSVNAQLKLEHDGTGSSDLVYEIAALGVGT